MSKHDVIVMGASAGGVEALRTIARGLPGELQAAILVVIHTSPQGFFLMPDILNKVGKLPAVKSVDGAPIERGRIYVAPPDYHLLVKQGRISLSRGPKENRTRPAIDPLFRTAAAFYGPRVIGVILTGNLDDGTAGLSAVKERGGIAVIQDPQDAQYPSMPMSALRHVGADHTVPLDGIASLLTRLVEESAETPERHEISRRLEIESAFAEMKTMEMKDMDEIGTHAGISCPDCHGPIWRIRDRTIQRFRCHVGHAYTAASMIEGQIEAQESHLWQALRMMKERVSLLRDVGSLEGDEPDLSARKATIARLERNIDLIQEMVEEKGALAGTGDASKGDPES